MDPTHNIIANQLVISLKNLIHPGYFFFYGNLLSPYYKFLLNAVSVVNPASRLVPNLEHNSSRGILCSSIFWIYWALASVFAYWACFPYVGITSINLNLTLRAFLRTRSIRVKSFIYTRCFSWFLSLNIIAHSLF